MTVFLIAFGSALFGFGAGGAIGYIAGRTGIEMTALGKIRLTKAEVGYVDRTTMKTRCEVCRHFVQPDACQVVGGKINPKGWCKEFEK